MNSFLARSFADGEAIIALKHHGDENAAKIRAVLDDPAGAQSMVDRAREVYSNSHTWAHRMDGLIEAIRS
ncbi:MAG: glycosyltransferase family 1 protein [Rhodospirillales bacterium]|nr:glycosyltransferase family 1 protein [Rhodospirillales bacterium]